MPLSSALPLLPGNSDEPVSHYNNVIPPGRRDDIFLIYKDIPEIYRMVPGGISRHIFYLCAEFTDSRTKMKAF